jgi:hypothetical protein
MNGVGGFSTSAASKTSSSSASAILIPQAEDVPWGGLLAGASHASAGPPATMQADDLHYHWHFSALSELWGHWSAKKRCITVSPVVSATFNLINTTVSLSLSAFAVRWRCAF